ncbi:hypothetical protein BDV18DRAFT_149399 [Aspergillus unguis]
MQSQLTRRVFRAILNNEPLISSQCRNRCFHTFQSARPRRIVYGPSSVQRRALFAFNFGSPSTPPESTLPSEVGLKEMTELFTSIRNHDRLPELDVLGKAYYDFFETRAEEPGTITQFQGQLLNTTWHHLQTHEAELRAEEWHRVLSDESLGNVLYVLSKADCLPEARGHILALSRSVFLALCTNPRFGKAKLDRLALATYIEIQALHGDPDEAMRALEKFWKIIRTTRPSPWLSVLKGFAIGGSREDIIRIVKKIGKYNVSFDPDSQEELIHFLIGQNIFNAVKVVYDCSLSGNSEPNLSTKAAVIKFALSKSDSTLAQSVFESVGFEAIPETINIRLLWEATQGKDATQISEVVQSLTTKELDLGQSISISCVNDLVEYANSINNPTLALGYLELASVWDLVPDALTQSLHLESLIQIGNVDEVLKFSATMDDLDTTRPETLPLMNKLITMLCLSKPDDALYDRISSLLDPILQDNIRLEAETLAALTHMLLYRHDLEAISELLRPNLGSYPSDGRTKVRKPLIDFILDLSQDSEPAWEAYMLLQLAFPKTSVSTRSTIMMSFFQRKRSDLAFLVFGHMRQAEDSARRPKAETYARCFRGFAHTQDAKHLELVHNMLKLDTDVNLSTNVLNWLMFAYAECDNPEKSMQIFREILQSKEGPTHHTILFFFRTCEKHQNGTYEAMKMLDKLKRLEVPPGRELYTAYVEALAAQCESDLATQALDAMEEVTGHAPDATSIGYLYNAIPYQLWKDEVEKWAKDKYPELWAQLEGFGRQEHEEGLQFKLARKNLTSL